MIKIDNGKKNLPFREDYTTLGADNLLHLQQSSKERGDNMQRGDLPSCPLFEGVPPEALPEELNRLRAAERCYDAGETLLAAGSPTERMGLVLEGELHAILPLPQGRQLLQSRLLRGELFGQLLALDGGRESPVTVMAHTRCRVLWIPMKNLLAGGGTPSSARLLGNLCRQLSSAYFSLQRRLICLTQPTLRERLLYYLRTERHTQGSDTVRLPFGRAGLADYLGADRSALCRVLSGLRREGLVDYDRQHPAVITLRGETEE